MSTKKSTKCNAPIIMIRPHETLIDGEITNPEAITMTSIRGINYDILKVEEILEAYEAKHYKVKTVKFARIKRFNRAFKTAMSEALTDQPQV